MRAMAKKPAERFASAEALLAALEETVAAPARKAASLRRFASVVGFGVAMAVAAVGSAQWAKVHATALDVPLPSPSASVAPIAVAGAAPFAPLPAASTVILPSVAPASTPLLMTVPVNALPHDTHAAARSHGSSRPASIVHLEHAGATTHEVARR